MSPRKSQAGRMADVAEQVRKQLSEEERFLGVQVRIWRSLTIILSHHPDLAKACTHYMFQNGTYVGDIGLLEKQEKRLLEQAQKCGRSSGIFEGEQEKPQCSGTSMKELWMP